MKKLMFYILASTFLIGHVSTSFAADVEVEWTNPDKYRDIDAGDSHRKHFKERTFKSFEKHFNKLAQSLPAEQKLVINVTDVDLAGDVNFGGIHRIRIIKSIYFPRMEFSYKLLDAEKNIIKEDELSLKDMSFMIGTRLKYSNESLSYEKDMLDDWFRKTFLTE